MVSVGLDGNINYLDPRTSKIERVVKGHQKGITALASSGDKFWTGSYDGGMYNWDLSHLSNGGTTTEGHSNQVVRLKTEGTKLLSCGMDDSLKITSAEK